MGDSPITRKTRFGAIEAPSIVGRGSAWLPMGCAETFVLRLPDNYHQAARDALAHRPRSAGGCRRSLAVVPLIGDKRYYGEAPMRLRGDCRPICGNSDAKPDLRPAGPPSKVLCFPGPRFELLSVA